MIGSPFNGSEHHTRSKNASNASMTCAVWEHASRTEVEGQGSLTGVVRLDREAWHVSGGATGLRQLRRRGLVARRGQKNGAGLLYSVGPADKHTSCSLAL